MINFDHGQTRVLQAVAFGGEIVEAVGLERQMVRERIESEITGNVGFVALAEAGHIAKIPERNHLIIGRAGRVEGVTGLAAAHVGDLDLHQVEAHHVGVEAMGGLKVLDGECNVADAHGVDGSGCR